MNLNRKVCYIDLDGVLAPYPECWLEYITIKTGKNFDSLEIAKNRLSQSDYTALKNDYRNSDFKYNLTPIQGSPAFIESLRDKGYFVAIVTSRPKSYPRLKERTGEWLRKNNILCDELLFVENKSAILSKYPDLLFGLEDEIDYCNEMARRGCKMFLMRNHNNSNLHEDVVVADSFEYVLREAPMTMIDALNPWFYRLKIGGSHTKPGIGTDYDEEFLRNRQENRKEMVIDSWATKENVKNKTVLDIACNAGYWSYCLYEMGASRISGIEGRARCIRQAELFYKSNNVNCEYEFIEGNVADLNIFNSIEPHDIVICAGILYHIPNWEAVLRVVSNLAKKFLVIDTNICKEDMYIQEPFDHFNAISGSSRKRIPTKRKLLSILKDKFFEAKIIKPTFKDMKGLNGADSYNQGRRLCIVAKKNSG